MTGKQKKSPKAQHRLFEETARELECNESEKAFDKALAKIGRASVPRKPEKRKQS
jgi:hypothetical protein